MNSLLKLALGAVLAVAVIRMLDRTRSSAPRQVDGDTDRSAGRGTAGTREMTLDEVGGENAVWGGGGSGLNS